MRLIAESKLLFLSGGFKSGSDEWTFYTQNGTETVYDPHSLISKILPMCNGKNSLREIMRRHEILSDSQVYNTLAEMAEKSILVDVDQLHHGLLKFLDSDSVYRKKNSQETLDKVYQSSSLPAAKNELYYVENVVRSSLGALAATRRTTYQYSKCSFSQNVLFGMFWNMYGRQGYFDERLSHDKYTVPSGGGLYGLRVDLFLFQTVGNMEVGHYLWRPDTNSFEIMKEIDFLDFKNKIYKKDLILDNVVGVFTVSGHIDRIAQKYGAAASPLAFLDAGHVMQNAYLYASQENLGIAEIYGFNRSQVKMLIDTDEYEYHPIVSGIFGIAI